MKKPWITALMLPAALAAATPACATELLSEGFENLAGLGSSGWVITNESSPVGLIGWFQGNEGIFTAQAGPDNSYLSSNFNATTPGGTLSNWLITPTFSTAEAGNVSFWVRGAAEDGFEDQFAFGFSSGSSVTSDFIMSTAMVAPGGWNLVKATFAAQGAGTTGRFAIAHIGPEPSSNYMGVDSLSIATTAVPEPATWAMMLVGFAMAGASLRYRRRRIRTLIAWT